VEVSVSSPLGSTETIPVSRRLPSPPLHPNATRLPSGRASASRAPSLPSRYGRAARDRTTSARPAEVRDHSAARPWFRRRFRRPVGLAVYRSDRRPQIGISKRLASSFTHSSRRASGSIFHQLDRSRADRVAAQDPASGRSIIARESSGRQRHAARSEPSRSSVHYADERPVKIAGREVS